MTDADDTEARLRRARRLRERLLRGPYVYAPFGPEAEFVDTALRRTTLASLEKKLKACADRNLEEDEALQLVAFWVYYCHQIPHLCDEELVALKAAVDNEWTDECSSQVDWKVDTLLSWNAEPQSSFLLSVREAIDLEITFRVSVGRVLPEAEPWAAPEYSVSELCGCEDIRAGNMNAGLRALLLQPAATEMDFHSADAKMAYAWEFAIYNVEAIPDAELEDFRAALAVVVRGCNDLHPEAIAVQMRDALSAETARRAAVAAALSAATTRRVMVTIMLARESRRSDPAPPPEHLTPAEKLAWELAKLPSRPLEMVAEALERQCLAHCSGQQCDKLK